MTSALAREKHFSVEFRQRMAACPKGVAVVASILEGDRVGMAVDTFTSVSLDPPLVLFCPSRCSVTWPGVEASGRFCVSVLPASGASLARKFARSGVERFKDVETDSSERGMPIIAEAISWFDCDIETCYPAGDHLIALGRVVEMGGGGGPALLFHDGRFGTTTKKAPIPPGLGRRFIV